MLISRINRDNHTPSVLHPLGEARYLLTLTEGRGGEGGGGGGKWWVEGGKRLFNISLVWTYPFPLDAYSVHNYVLFLIKVSLLILPPSMENVTVIICMSKKVNNFE